MRNAGFSLVLLAVLLTFSGIAASIPVTSTADNGPGSLRQAITIAAAGDTINFTNFPAGGTISLTNGELLINKSLIIDGPGAALLTVERSTAGGTTNFRIFNVQSGTVTISGITVSNGHANVGGGINNDTALTLRDCIIAGNTAVQTGGGINNTIDLTLSNCTVRANSVIGAANAASGGGIFNHGTLTVLSCIINSNSAASTGSSGLGGGIYNDVHLSVTNSVINANSAIAGGGADGSGGGIFNQDDLTINTTTIASNSATGGNGGAIGGAGQGGGIANLGQGVVLDRSTVNANVAQGGLGTGGSGPAQGGGIANLSGTMSLDNCTVSGNTANGGGTSIQGGGIFNDTLAISLTHSTITTNQGGGVFNTGDGSVELKNTILTGNTVTFDLFNSQTRPINSEGFNVIGSTNGPFVAAVGDLFILNADALRLGPLTNNGGPTLTHALLCGSPAINVGDNTGAPATDQRGFPRIVGGRIDIGSFEYSNTPPTITCQSDTNLNCDSATGATAKLLVTVADADGNPLTVLWSVAGTSYQTNHVSVIGSSPATVEFEARFAIGAHEVKATVSDTSECVASCTILVTVSNTGPVLSCSPNKTNECGIGSVDFDSPRVSDNCGTANITILGTITNRGCGSTFVATRTWLATDQFGGSNVCSQTIAVQDTTPPSITCPSNLVVSCLSQAAPETNSVITSDRCGGAVAVIWQGDLMSSSNCAGQFVITRTYRATDLCGNSAICTQTITVQDTNPPSITCPTNLTVSCANLAPPDISSVSTSDNCGGAVTVTWQGDSITSSNCPGQFVIRRTYRANDQCGNSATCSQTITVQDDTPPTITCSSNLGISCAREVPTPNTTSVTTSDNCGGAVAVTWQGDSISSSNCVGQFVIRRTYRATDLCGNSATCTQTITVNDTNPPSITCPTNLTASCANQVPAPDINSVTTGDACGGAVSVTWQGDSISSSNCVGQFVISRTYRATDPCGNSATCVQTITVNDTNPPTITCPTNLTASCASQVPAPNINNVTTSDSCGGAVTVTWQGDSITSSNCVGQFVISRTYRATDLCGNGATCTQTITVNDTNPPSITCATNLTASCASQVPAPNINTVTATDGCGGAVTVTWQGDSLSSSNCAGQFVISRTYRATDPCGNSATCVQTITVNDTNPPTITCPTNLTASCASQVPAPNINSVTTSDSCGGTVTVTWQGDSITSSNCVGQFVISRTYRATDPCGNSATCVQTITVNDTNPPSITCPTNLTASCASQVPAPNINTVTTSDSCGGAVTVTWQGDSISSSNCVGQFVISRTYRATDPCGNSATCVQTITVNDTNPPSITCPTNLTASCASQVPAPNINTVTATDSCGGAVTVTWQGDSISSSNCVGQFVISRTYRATDPCGNSATCVQTITVNDTNPPSITCPTNLTASCASQVPDPNVNSVTTSDSCGGAVTVTWQGDSITSSNCAGQFVFSRTYRATDLCGNSATCVQTITVNDTNPPSITCPTNLTASCASQVPAPNINSVTTSDNCGGAVTVTWQGDTISSSNCPGQFVINRTYRATDQCGNSATCAQTITVRDSTPPTITCPSNLTATCASQVPPNTTSVTTSDNCGGAVTVTWEGDSVTSSNCLSQFTISRLYRATDQCGNSATCTQMITVQDTTPPSISCPSNLTASCSSQVPLPNTNSVTTSDACGGAVAVTWGGDSISSSNCPGQFVIRRTYTATNLCGNSSSCTQTITVIDTNPPSITCPTNLTANCASQVPAPNINSVTTSDSCGGAVTVTWQGDSVSSSNCAGQFVISRIYRATDLCGNSATCTQTITVNDTNPPSITCPTNLTASCASQVPAPNINSVTTSNSCGGAVTVTWQGDSISSSNCVGQFVISRTYRATDLCGNSSTCTQTITVNDTNPPSITCPTNLIASCANLVPAPNINSVTTSDNCGGAVTVTWQGDSISSSNCVGQFVIGRTYRATDLCGNSATCTQTITVNDTNPPSITCPTNLTANCASQVPAPNINSVTTSDSCGGAVTVTWQGDSISSSNCVGQFVIGRIYRATDLCGNSATCTQTITVNDNNPPSITCPTNLTASCASQVPAPNINTVTATDGCGGAVAVTWQGDSISSSNCVGRFVVSRSYRATDLCGNSATCVQTITVNDTNPPSITCPTNLTASCANQVPAPNINTVTATDGCGGAVTVTWQGDSVSSSNCVGQFVISRTYRATDPCGNSATCTQTITVSDTNPPSITCPTNLTASCASQVPGPNINSVTTSDSCGGAVTVTWQGDSITSSNCAGQFVFNRTYRATDLCGNSASCVQIITVNDTNPPSITCPTNLTVSCASQVPAPNINSVTTSDSCGGPVTVTWQGDSITSSNCAGQFVFSRAYRATDLCGNSASCIQIVTVNDTNPPVIVCSGNRTNECGAGSLNFDIPTASDNCGTATISILSTVTNLLCGNTFVATRTWVATDACGRSNTCSQTIASVDTTRPTIICSGNKTNTNSGLDFDTPIFSDTCNAVTIQVLSTITNFACNDQFVATRTWAVTDACGNSNTCSQIIATPNAGGPTISCPAPQTISCAPATGAPVTLSVSVADASGVPLIVVWTVDGTLTQTNIIAGGTAPTSTNITYEAAFFPGIHQISVTVVDPNACSASCVTTVTVLAGGAPTVSCPAPFTLSCSPQPGSVGTVSIQVMDPAGERMVVIWSLNGIPIRTNIVAASNPPALSRVDLVALFPAGTNFVTAIVSNSSGCTVSCSTIVTVVGLGDLYPIALNIQTLAGVPVGGVLRDIYNGSQFGNFGWLTWAGSPSEPTLVTSLTPPGNSSNYINPKNRRDHVVSIGDWVQGKPGVSNSDKVRKALNVLETIDITVPVWDQAVGRGNNSLYHVVAFARVRLLNYQLPNQNRITARFLGFVDCSGTANANASAFAR